MVTHRQVEEREARKERIVSRWQFDTMLRGDAYGRQHTQRRPWGELFDRNNCQENQLEFEHSVFMENVKNTLNLGIEVNKARFSIERVKGGHQQLMTSGVSIDTVSYSGEAPAHYDFTSGNTVEPEAWDLGFITIPVYAPGVGTFYMPSVHVNYEQGIKVAILEDVPFEDLSSIPDEITWLEDVGELRNLGYLGAYEILVYHPEPPYNHKVIVEYLNRMYVVEAEGQFYKIRFLEYSSGVLLFEYAAL